MKKIFLLLFAVTLCIAAKAQNSLYLEGTLSQNGEGKLSLMITNDEPLMMVQGDITLPAGITITGINSTCNISADGNSNDGVYTFIFLEVADVKIDANSTPTKIGEILVSCENVATGTYPVQIDGVKMANYPSANGVSCTGPESNIKVQKAAVLEPQDDDFVFDITPAVISSSTTTLPILLKNKLDVANFKLEVTYPEGIAPKTGRGVSVKVNNENLYSSTDDGVAPLTASQAVSGQVATYTITNPATDTYMAKGEFYEILQVPVTVTAADAICNIKVKVSDIVAYDADNDVNLETPINVKGGEFMTSLFAGTPVVDDAILYGNYSSTVASTLSTALKNVAIADVTASTVAGGAKFNDVLVNEKGGNSYYTRTSANYGTTVLPFNLTTENVTELYEITDMSSKSITIKGTDFVAANTPCIFKGTINVAGATPTLVATSEQVLGLTTFKGTYEATTIADGAGYYIASDGKFYGDGASIAPFRAYFEGTISGVKEFRVNLETPNGLIDITDQFSSEDIYNLQGIRVQNANKGVNIVGGKKVYVK